MTTKEKALRIAELEKYRRIFGIDEISADKIKFLYQKDYENPIYEQELISKYSTFNGLMEIVERALLKNSDLKIEIIPLNNEFFETVGFYLRIYSTDGNVEDIESKGKSLIDALQDAIIFYNKNKEVKE